MHGKGKLSFADGGLYEGEFKQGKVCGKGKYTSREGNISEGNFVDGMLEGKNGVDTYVEGASFRVLPWKTTMFSLLRRCGKISSFSR